jgi:hypothetical protein
VDLSTVGVVARGDSIEGRQSGGDGDSRVEGAGSLSREALYIIIVRLLILVRIFANSTRVLGRIRRVLEYSTRGPPE